MKGSVQTCYSNGMTTEERYTFSLIISENPSFIYGTKNNENIVVIIIIHQKSDRKKPTSKNIDRLKIFTAFLAYLIISTCLPQFNKF